MTELKPLEEMFAPDRRHEGFVLVNPRTGESRPLELADFHAEISEVELTGNPPEDVVNHFTIARNLFVYSWFVYDFTTPALAHAYGSVEFALRERHKIEGISLGKKWPGLRKLFRSAIGEEWLKDSGYDHLFPQHSEEYENPFYEVLKRDPEGTEYCETLLKTLPSMRNSLVHGSSYLDTPGGTLFPMKVCAATINQLFPPTKPAENEP